MQSKFLIIVSFLMFACNFAYGQTAAQKSHKGKIGLTFSSFGQNQISTGNVSNDTGYNADHFYNFGITYLYPFNSWLSAETGVEYSKQKMKIHYADPNAPNSNTTSDFILLDIPLTVRFNFLHYFFANLGLLVDIASQSSPITSGLGEMGGIGAQYSFKNGISLFVNPYLKTYSTISFSSPGFGQKLYEDGFRFGVLYNL